MMYGVEEADLVQVVRNPTNHGTKPIKNNTMPTVSTSPSETSTNGSGRINGAVKPSTDGSSTPNETIRSSVTKTNENTSMVNHGKTKSATTAATTTSTDDSKATDTIEIVINRVSLSDSVMRHQENWVAVVLPRIRSFVEAVYRVRRDDTLRFSLLQAMAGDQQQQSLATATAAAWDILHSQCPWLLHCDTAFRSICRTNERLTTANPSVNIS